jgi:uncharacterized phage protein gp47/JayE
MTFELTDQGVQVQTVQEILDELETAARNPTTGVHPQLDVSATSVFGQIFGIWAEREALIQQAIRAVQQNFGPKATGQSLANIALLTGTVKRGQTKSQVGVTVTLTAGATLPSGSRVNAAGDSQAIFETLTPYTNATGITADVAAVFTAVNAGPVRAPSGSLTVINTPVSGWLVATNPFDADVGLDFETDVELRTRRVEELRIQGSTVLQAIEADVETVPGVLDVRGFENTTNGVVFGMQPHSYEIVIYDGVSPQANSNVVAQTIWNSGPAGIATSVSVEGAPASGVAVDDEGFTHTVLFTRAAQVTFYATAHVVTDSDFPVDGSTQIRAAIVAAVNAPKGIGRTVVLTRLYQAIYAIAGVVDVDSLVIGPGAGTQVAANLDVTDRSIAIADSSRITVTL